MEDVGASFHELDVLFLGISVLAVHYRVFKSAKEKKRDGTIIKNCAFTLYTEIQFVI